MRERGLPVPMHLWDNWLDLIFDDLENERKRQHRDPSNVSLPAWVRRIDAQLERMLLPVRRKAGERLTAKRVGELLGQTYAYYGWILDSLRRPQSALSDRFKKGVREFLEEDYEPMFEDFMRTTADEGVVFHWIAFQHVVKRALCLAVERPLMEAAEFVEGFSAAVARRAGDRSIWTDKFTTAATYYVLRRDWEFVVTFRNLSDLHIYLQIKLGRGAAGDLDRIRTLAKRLGLKLAPRGRPSKKWVRVPK